MAPRQAAPAPPPPAAGVHGRPIRNRQPTGRMKSYLKASGIDNLTLKDIKAQLKK
jgi:hypothetical protein